MSNDINDQLIAIVGYSGTGKSAALRNIRNQSDWVYLNTEAGKRLPFKNQFKNYRIDDPYQVIEAFQHAIEHPDFSQGIIIDSLTFLMDMYETQYVINSVDGRSAWNNYQQYFKDMMQNKVVLYGKPVIFTAHVRDEYNEKALETNVSIPIKGALKGTSIEAYFSTIVAAKKIPVKDLEPYHSDLLNITDEDKELGFKHVFQTRITKTTTGERIRSPMGLFTKEQTYIDNDAQILLDHLHNFYK